LRKPFLHYDGKNGVLYIAISEGEEHHFVELAEDIAVEFDKDNQPIGVEILNASKLIGFTIGRERLALASA